MNRYYFNGWTADAYDEAIKDRKVYQATGDLLLVPEILLNPDHFLYHSAAQGLAWIEGRTVENDQIAVLTTEQINQLIKDGLLVEDEPRED